MLKEKYIEFRANKFRDEHGMSATEAIDPYKMLSKVNIITVFKGMSEKFSGMAVKTEDSRFMLVNSNDIKARQHFTICHELYHLFIQENFRNRICYVGTFSKKDKEEYNADWFASYLLMPEAGIFELIPKDELEANAVSLNTVVKMEQYFGVSRSALLNRLRFLDLISKEQIAEYKKPGMIVRSAIMMGFSDVLYEPDNYNKVIGDYGEKAKKLFDRTLISETDYYGLMLDIGIDLDKKIKEDGKAEG